MDLLGFSLNQARDAAELAATLAAASEVGVFPALAESPDTADGVAARLQLDARAVRILLPALADMGALRANGDRYEVPDDVRRELVDTSAPEYVAGGLPLWLRNIRIWTRLPEALRTGLPQSDKPEGEDRDSVRRFMAGMAAAPVERVRRLVRACLARFPGARSVLDVGGGPGHFAREFIHHGVAATLFDRPDIIEFVGEEYGLRELPGMSLAAGDFTVEPLPEGPFDIVLISNVSHIYSPAENRELLGKAHAVTSSGGLLALADFVRGYTPKASRFALVMLLRTEHGNVYGEAEYRDWLSAAGYGHPQFEDLDVDRQLITAVREG